MCPPIERCCVTFPHECKRGLPGVASPQAPTHTALGSTQHFSQTHFY
uniref:Uncharacterized protein n=1 Tax=Anguilla anguilla TaxID=7936 RepID=A0A0E9UAI5_ANGAN